MYLEDLSLICEDCGRLYIKNLDLSVNGKALAQIICECPKCKKTIRINFQILKV